MACSLPGYSGCPSPLAGSRATAGRTACIEVLGKLRNIPVDHEYIIEEVIGHHGPIAYEEELVSSSSFRATLREMWNPATAGASAIGIMLFIFMQMAGSNSINYYSPIIFESMGLSGTDSALFATGVYGWCASSPQ